ncbi:type I restriction endonuclease subunit R [Acetobacterium woodii]|uniref:Type I restriction enzyme endonuclease subunit n=1 Tax=Acetobacterium woodii (strain ATCC 29683 / DSM 1030 / JCM 2381 / KCTC 1655 / WB1) TaxID=931626 RepID=H6LBT5_ACEWD|nr:type I restriction endonuclease subunit R [Acetobacterium woodii]AFA47678.1 type I restriction-modification system restriction subunit HsdR1 [Acetobacterium woodii DSM 1030]
MSLAENFTEAFLEEAAIEILTGLGYAYAFGPDISPGGEAPERQDHREVILAERVKDALFRINRDLPQEALDEAYRQIITFNSPMLAENNRHFHRLLTEGIEVSFSEKGNIRTKRAFVINYEQPETNDFLVVNQFTIIEHEERRPDLILFINGLPLIVVELKSASDENVGISSAYNQIQTYKKDLPNLFVYNAFCILSDGINAKAGTLTSNEERFMNWRTVDGVVIEPKANPQYEVLFHGMLKPQRVLEIIRYFILFQESQQSDTDKNGQKLGDKKAIIKILAAYHQYFAVQKAVEKTREAAGEDGDRKIGVIWHTQGSGKSFSMVFYTAALVRELNNPTIVVITDRNDLDDQLFATFSKSQDILRQTPKLAHTRKLTASQKAQQNGTNAVAINGLYELLNDREAGGIIFTTIQKFTPESGEMPVLTDRKNVIIIADEAHRSQYGLAAKTDLKSGAVKYGYAKYLRDALPNASFIGFTGTPIDLDDRSTTSVFGQCIDTYDMTRAVEDEATVRIYYENRIIKLDTVDTELIKIDAAFEDITEGQEDTERDKNKATWSRLEAVVGSPNRIKKLAEDIIAHYEEKSKAITGKAMVVCMSRRICAELYDAMVTLRADWHSDDVNQGKIKVVMTGSAADSEKLQPHIGGKQRRDTLAKRMKDNSDELSIVLVRDMWLTGFDVPSLHTMYIDKPMQGHGLMQAIARVNRVFKEKSGGVVVDYLGILESLKKALNQYTNSDRGNTGIDVNVAVAIMTEKLEILKDMMHGYDFSAYFGDSKVKRLRAITGGMDFVLGKSMEDQKEFKTITIELAKSHSLCAATEDAKARALEVNYFKAVKASMVKFSDSERVDPTLSKQEVEARLHQLLERSIISEDVIDVFDVMGIKRPDISLLSEDFLEEVRAMKEKNLAVEMLRKLLEGNIKGMERSNLVKSEKFSEKLQKALNKYRNQAITNAEVIEELIRMAHEIRQMKEAEAKLGLSEDEIAFYDALTADEIVREFMEDDTLKTIAQELTIAIRNNITIDWSVRKSAQASMRKIIKRLLKKYKYPPDQADKALKIVMRQAEKMCGNVVVEGFWYDKVAEEKAEYRV